MKKTFNFVFTLEEAVEARVALIARRDELNRLRNDTVMGEGSTGPTTAYDAKLAAVESAMKKLT